MQPMETESIANMSKILSGLLRELCSQRNMVMAEISDLEREHDNITHRMESPDCKYKERARIATQLATLRCKRRVLKDWLKINQPYFDYIGGNDGERVQKMLSNLVGVGRRVEKTKSIYKV